MGEQRVAKDKKNKNLKSLFKIFFGGMCAAVAGAWLLAAFRLNLVGELLGIQERPELRLFLDFVFLVIAILGLLTAVSVLGELFSRIDRVVSLDEEKW